MIKEVEEKICQYPRYWEIRPCLIPKHYKDYYIVPVIQYQNKKMDNPYKIGYVEFEECPEHDIEEIDDGEEPHPFDDERENMQIDCILLHLYYFFTSGELLKQQTICVNNIKFVSEMGNAATPEGNQVVKYCDDDYDRITVEVGMGESLRCVSISAMKDAKKVGHNIIIL